MADLNFTIVAVPYRGSDEQRTAQFQLLQQTLGHLGPVARQFMVPALKVGTLDSLLEASDELAKLDPQLEGACFKLAGILEEVSGQQRSHVTMLRINPQQHDVSAEFYLKEFSWNQAQYDTKEPVLSLLSKLAHVVAGAEDRTRGLLMEYTEGKNKLVAASRKTTGSLAVKPIGVLVRQWCVAQGLAEPTESEFLTTVFVVVPKREQDDFTRSYSTYHQFVVPKSQSVVTADDHHVLNAIVCFKKVVDDVKIQCRKRKYVLRDANADDELSGADLDALQQKVSQDKDKLTLLVSQQFTLCYVAWMHAKVIRVFVESMLRYGLPPKFVPVLIAADPKKEDELREKLGQLYADYASKFQQGNDGMADTGALQHEYPYVSLKVANILRHH
jgi:V-type H+-transporting ATPase subunit C